MTRSCTEKDFFDSIPEHTMVVRKDDDLYRHLTFTNKGSNVYRFDLMAWPGELVIQGSCGTYAFSRVPDMFEFFRADEFNKKSQPDSSLHINPAYWGEKLRSVCTQGGFREYDEDAFIQRVSDHVECRALTREQGIERGELWQAVLNEVIVHSDNEIYAYDAVNSFNYRGFTFEDFFDSGGTARYTYQYLWCLYAIVYGIGVYDKYKKENSHEIRSKND